jgi:hypothetical protein
MLFANSVNAATGQVCISSIPEPNREKRQLSNPAGGGRVFDFSVQIDSGEIKALSHETSVLYGGLDLEEKHWVRIRNKGKQVESFRFSFKQKESNSLCLWFGPFYGTWSLWPQSGSHHLCKCES